VTARRSRPKDALQDGVVLLHGISRTSRSFRKMQAAIEGCGFATLTSRLRDRRKALEQLAEDIHPAIEGFAAGHRRLDPFRRPSMGGLLARAYLGKYRPKRLGRVVMLAPQWRKRDCRSPENVKAIAPGSDRPDSNSSPSATGARRDPSSGRLPGRHHRGKPVDHPISSALLPKPHDGRVSV